VTSAPTPPRPSPTITLRIGTFTGRINGVQLDIGEDDQDHLISSEDRLRLAMTRQ
jgi:arylsulfatase